MADKPWSLPDDLVTWDTQSLFTLYHEVSPSDAYKVEKVLRDRIVRNAVGRNILTAQDGTQYGYVVLPKEELYQYPCVVAKKYDR